MREERNEEQIKEGLVELLADSPTALICMACDFMDIHAPCMDWSVRCLTPQLPPLVGEAITIKLDCSTPDSEYPLQNQEAVPEEDLYIEMISRMEESSIPQVVVIQSLGDKSRGAVAGDGMAKTFLAAGAAGIITDGPVRDLDDMAKVGCKTFGAGRVVNHYSLRWSALGEPVAIGGLTIKTGDLVHGDGDGVITLPREGWPKLVGACRCLLDFEKKAHVTMRRTDIPIREKNSIVKEKLVPEYRKMIQGMGDFMNQ